MPKIIAFIALCFFLTGCGTTAKFIYPAKMSSLIQYEKVPSNNKKVAIVPFDDYRGDRNNVMFWMSGIPLVPFGWGTYERPDAARQYITIESYDVTPSEDLAKAAAVSFRHSNLFKDAYFTFGGEKDAADFVLSGKLKTMKYHGKRFSYCLPSIGVIFWILGAPAGMSENHLVVDFTLTDKSGKVLWQWTLDKEDWIVQWIYARMGHDCILFTSLYQAGMNEALTNLAEKMREHPELFQ